MSVQTNYISRNQETRVYINKLEAIKEKMEKINKEIEEKQKQLPAPNSEQQRIIEDQIKLLNEQKGLIQTEIEKVKDQLEELTKGLEETVAQIPENAHTNLNNLLSSIQTQINEVTNLMPNIVTDWNQHINKSPLSYLIYTNKLLIDKAQQEYKNIKTFMDTRKTRQPILYKSDAIFRQIPKKGVFSSIFRKKGGSAKTVRNRKRA